MAFNAVKVSEVIAQPAALVTPDNDQRYDLETESGSTRNRYDLASALGVVRQMETSAGRAAVYEEIKNKNFVYRLVDVLYAMAGARVLQPLLLFLYMVKCAVSLGPFDDEDAEVVSISNFDNEHKTISRVTALVPDVQVLRLRVERKHVFTFAQFKVTLKMLVSARRIWPFLRRLARTHTFMPSARIASALAYYMRFSWLFLDQPSLRATIVASNYSPEAVGMAAAAHRMARRVVYSNHAPVPANGAVVPPVYADCALFYGEKTTKTYRERSACTADVAYFGQPGTSRPMVWRDNVKTVGIFLTSGTKIDVLRSLIATIRVDLPNAHILIRQHPVLLLKTDFSGLAIDDENVELTIGNPLDDEIAACDLVICGNSGVALNVLSGGRPVAYISSLDGIMFDANGFVASRLVHSLPWWSEDAYDRLKAFYQAPGWKDVMRSYDASNDADMDRLKQVAANVLMSHLRPNNSARAKSKTGRFKDSMVA